MLCLRETLRTILTVLLTSVGLTVDLGSVSVGPFRRGDVKSASILVLPCNFGRYFERSNFVYIFTHGACVSARTVEILVEEELISSIGLCGDWFVPDLQVAAPFGEGIGLRVVSHE